MSLLDRKETYTDLCNQRIFKLLSIYLNLAPDYVEKEMIEAITCGDKSGEDFAFANLAAVACGLDIYDNGEDKQFFRSHFLPCFKRLEISTYLSDPYYRSIRFPEGKCGKWTFENMRCKAYQAFVYDDPKCLTDGRIIPQIGFFDTDYLYPAVLENGREWMTLLPNETNTTKPALEASCGKVLTFGLGLGYFAYMASLKDTVSSVTVVERSPEVIELFKEFILPQFPDPGKIKIIESDAFDYARDHMAEGRFDTVFTDLWHDPADGCELYLRMKEYEYLLPNAKFVYWVEETLKLYL